MTIDENYSIDEKMQIFGSDFCAALWETLGKRTMMPPSKAKRIDGGIAIVTDRKNFGKWLGKDGKCLKQLKKMLKCRVNLVEE